MGVWQGVAIHSVKYRYGLPCLTFLFPVGWPLLKQPYGGFRVSLPAGREDSSRLLPLWTLHAVRL
jgi:hypothetical protein